MIHLDPTTWSTVTWLIIALVVQFLVMTYLIITLYEGNQATKLLASLFRTSLQGLRDDVKSLEPPARPRTPVKTAVGVAVSSNRLYPECSQHEEGPARRSSRER